MIQPVPMTQGAQAPALSQQLVPASQCLLAVQSGRSLSDVLPQVPSALRPGVQALLFQVLRQLGLAEALRQQLAQLRAQLSADDGQPF